MRNVINLMLYHLCLYGVVFLSHTVSILVYNLVVLLNDHFMLKTQVAFGHVILIKQVRTLDLA